MQTKYFYILMFFLLSACEVDNSTIVDVANKKVRPVKLITIGADKSENLLNYPAVIEAAESSSLAFEVSGELKELFVNELQLVEKGEMLARLDQRDYQAKLDAALSQYKNANSEYQRAVNLYKEDAISKSKLEQRKSQLDISKTELKSADKALESTILVSPFSGVVAAVYIKENELVKAGQEAIVIQGKKGLEAKINLPASVIATASKENNRKRNEFIVLEAAPGRHIPATFKEISLRPDTVTQTYEATFSFKAPEDLNILPGMNATVWFDDPSTINDRTDTVRVPLTAVIAEDDQKYVWLVDSSTMIVSKKMIVIEAGVGENLKVISGLQNGDVIVAAGISLISDGMEVRPWTRQQ